MKGRGKGLFALMGIAFLLMLSNEMHAQACGDVRQALVMPAEQSNEADSLLTNSDFEPTRRSIFSDKVQKRLIDRNIGVPRVPEIIDGGVPEETNSVTQTISDIITEEQGISYVLVTLAPEAVWKYCSFTSCYI